ncbi:MAG: aminofutalosine synthase MqnE [Nitrospinota bacterium]|jgi:aminodeoxyfutalosine synthase|nr:aminofutalosine synthase MqnE [Nitrospinota bacterium]
MFSFSDPFLKNVIENKVINQERLSFDDGVALFNSQDLLGLGYLANIVRERKNGQHAFFINNRHINHTNICKNLCRFCAFSKKKEEENAYAMSIEEVLKAAESHHDGRVNEFHIVGGLHPDLPFSYYLDLLKALRNRFPEVHIQAFTAVEIAHLADIATLSVKQTLIELREAGLGSLPGGGAEIFNTKIRDKICPEKISGQKWLEVMKTAHELGLKSNATLLYGHIEAVEDRVDHLIQLRNLQDDTGGFLAFIPLAFHPKNTDFKDHQFTTGQLDLKVLAVSRLMLDNFPHIKAFWIMVGPKIAQLSLSFGVDDIDGTVVEEKITHAAGANTEEHIEKNNLIQLIQEAGRKPVERDTLYNAIS